MDFKAIQFFLFLYFVRPQDWIPGLGGAHLVMINMLWAVGATLFRPGGLTLSTLFKTPHDWVMLIYFGWVLWTSPDYSATFQDAKGLFLFYYITMVTLSSWGRMEKFLRLWTLLLVFIAALALGSEFGIDLTGAAAQTALQRGRLCLNTWMLDNANALGHTAIVAIPLTYFTFMWKRGSVNYITALAMIFIAGGCVFYTQSKGAFMVGLATLACSQIFGRPRIVQLTILALALTVGTAAVTQLPRMQTLSRSDEGIQGRLLAWQNARDTMKEHPYGVGWKNFIAHFRWEKEWVDLATHGSYVQVGAALGYGGLYLYLGVLYCGFRTVFQARTRNDEEERVRRMLFCLLLSYTLSNWMIDRAYHTEFFVIAASIAAFHRLTERVDSEQSDEEKYLENHEKALDNEFLEAVEPEPRPSPVPALPAGPVSAAAANSGMLMMTTMPADPIRDPRDFGKIAPMQFDDEDDVEDDNKPRISWRSIGVVDLAIIGVLLYFVLQAWDYILVHF